MKHRHGFWIIIVWLGIACTSCRFVFVPEPGGPPPDLPAAFSIFSEPGDGPRQWWESFRAPELNRLVEAALDNNLDIRQAFSRLQQVRAAAVATGADRSVQLDVAADGDMWRQRSDGGADASLSSGDRYSLGVAAGYEIDLWGRMQSETEAARLTAVASRTDLNAAAITVAAEVAVRWAKIIGLRMRRDMLEAQRDTNRIYLELVELRFRKGMVSALDVYQQRQLVEKVNAQMPLVDRDERLLCNDLAVLVGKPPGACPGIDRTRLPVPGPIPDAGVPADLLANRPDVRSAGLRLRAAEWQLAAARANRLPAIRLSATAAFGPGDLALVFDNWLLDLAASLTAPLYDGHRLAAEVDRMQAAVQEDLYAYRQAVYTAIREVEDALVSEHQQRQHIQALQRQVSAARNALNEARERYRKGLSTYLPVLTQLLSVQSLELDLLQQQTDLVVDRIDLYRSLGGTWPDRHDFRPSSQQRS